MLLSLKTLTSPLSRSPLSLKTPNRLFFKSPIIKMSTSATSPSSTVEHIVLFNVKDQTDPPKVNTMLTSLNSLTSLDSVLHLTAVPLLRVKSSPLPFTHILHSRYPSKDALSSYSLHPDHVSVVKSDVLPICDDVMAVDWVADDVKPPVSPGSAVRVSFLKLKEGVGDDVKGEVLELIKEMKGKFGGNIDEISCGENFSPARAKGYSIASLAVFKGVDEMEKVDKEKELVSLEKAKVKEYIESVIVLDFVVPSL